MAQLLFYGLVAGLFSLVGGFIVLWRADAAKKFIIPLLGFSAGAFLGVAFLDVLPEAVEQAADPHKVFIAVLAGFFLMFALERVLMKFSHGRAAADQGTVHSEHSESLPVLIVLSDSLHNFLDGVVIGLAYLANPALALPTALGIAAHEIPQEIGDFTILLDSGWKKINIIMANVLSSLLSVVGIVLAVYFGSRLEVSLPFLLAGVGGIFIYLAACDLIPEIQDRARDKNMFSILFAFLFGLVLVGYLVRLFEH